MATITLYYHRVSLGSIGSLMIIKHLQHLFSPLNYSNICDVKVRCNQTLFTAAVVTAHTDSRPYVHILNRSVWVWLMAQRSTMDHTHLEAVRSIRTLLAEKAFMVTLIWCLMGVWVLMWCLISIWGGSMCVLLNVCVQTTDLCLSISGGEE